MLLVIVPTSPVYDESSEMSVKKIISNPDFQRKCIHILSKALDGHSDCKAFKYVQLWEVFSFQTIKTKITQFYLSLKEEIICKVNGFWGS